MASTLLPLIDGPGVNLIPSDMGKAKLRSEFSPGLRGEGVSAFV
jgi:hypothetical protein